MADLSSAFGYGALYFGKESVAFGTVAAAFTYVEVISWTPTADQAYFDNEVVKQGLQQHTSGIVGHKSDSSAELVMYLHGYSSSTPSSAPDADDVHPDAQLMACALGGMTYGGYDGTGVVAGSTAAVVKFTDASSFEAGQAFLTDGMVGWIKSISTNDVTLLHDLESVPDNGSAIYGAITIWPTDQFDDTDSPSLSFRWLGLRSDDVTTYLGSRPNSLKIEGDPKGFLTMTQGWNIVDWERANSGGDPVPTTYGYPDENQIVSSRLLIQDNSDVISPMEADCSKFVIDTGLAISPKTDLNASQGVSEWRKTATMVTIELDPIQGIESTSAGWEYMYANAFTFCVVLQVGTAAGETISFCIPAAELVAQPLTADREGLNAKNLKLRGMANSLCTVGVYTGDSYPGNKTFMAAFL
jgi:hypothetical protein